MTARRFGSCSGAGMARLQWQIARRQGSTRKGARSERKREIRRARGMTQAGAAQGHGQIDQQFHRGSPGVPWRSPWVRCVVAMPMPIRLHGAAAHVWQGGRQHKAFIGRRISSRIHGHFVQVRLTVLPGLVLAAKGRVTKYLTPPRQRDGKSPQ
ncbi:hypothetical protein C4K09_2278 [Pseudomonas chlororaphis subsp. aureofaciens]|nr:hypothetical protein C4K09_2278 [Pseudomonas chlororaphis subsp. aureofaciens]